jgi:hypothetical protein
MASKISMRRKLVLGSAFGLLLLAQTGGTQNYNPGIPTVPGTHTPESNPATMVTAPSDGASNPAFAPGATSGNSATGTPTTATPGLSGNSGPAYSFGAAPPPVVAPAR